MTVIKDEKLARVINDTVIQCTDLLNESVRVVKEQSSEEEFRNFRLAVGHVLAEMLGILNPLYAEHPQLKPEGW